MIELRGIAHRADDGRPVLAGVDLDLARGDVAGLTGPNGGGKSLLLRVLATLVVPRRGRYLFDGDDALADPSSVRRRVGYLAASHGAPDGVTVREHLDAQAALHRVPVGLVDGVLELTDLLDEGHRVAATLSRGQRRRLELARVLLHDPEVLLLDDPAAGLDPAAQDELYDFLRELAALGRVVVVASHHADGLSKCCTRMLALRDGRVEEAS